MRAAKSKSLFNQLALHVSHINKSTAFTRAERQSLRLRGLLPPSVENIEQQQKRCTIHFDSFNSNLDKYTYLTTLKERNETLFYKLVMDNVKQMMPIIYTPTVGEACEKYDREFRVPQGMYFSADDKGEMKEMAKNWPHENVEIIVVSDGSRILGLGDLGSNGMGIPVGKLELYVVGGGFHPTSTLPIILDVGTNNKKLLKDPLYLGIKKKRITGEQYYALMDEFLRAVRARWPKVLVQFEDFSNDHCFNLLERYKDTLCFNDDIQGTGAVVLAGLINSMKILKSKLTNHKFVIMGAGSAAIGVADAISAYVSKHASIPIEEARALFWFVDSKGLVLSESKDLPEYKKLYARTDTKKKLSDLKQVIEEVKPTCLIGLCGQEGAFTEEIVKKMAKYSARPIIFALSNPTSNSECTAEQAFKWTKGKCIFAAGSPFDPVEYGGKKHTISQANNAYIFPGLGFGASLCWAKKVTQSMLSVSAEALAELVDTTGIKNGILYPDLSNLRKVSTHIASRVIAQAHADRVATRGRPDNIKQLVRAHQYSPSYPHY